MAQLILTQKYAKDCRITTLAMPVLIINSLDDWVIDVIRVQRKKVAMITHVRSILTFFIPYSHVGGTASIPACLGVLLQEYIRDHELEQYEKDIKDLFFSDQFIFTKTNNRKIIGHMNDFKNILKGLTTNTNFDNINWDKVHSYINNTLVKTSGTEYERPNDLMFQLLEHVYGDYMN